MPLTTYSAQWKNGKVPPRTSKSLFSIVRNYNFVWGLQFPDSSLFFPPPPGKAANYRNKKTIIRGELRWAA